MAYAETDEDGNVLMRVTVDVHKVWWAKPFLSASARLVWLASWFLSGRRLEAFINWLVRRYANNAVWYRCGSTGKWERLRMKGDDDEPRLTLGLG